MYNITCNNETHIYRVIHKSVKHFKNSQQIKYASNHGNSYAEENKSLQVFSKARLQRSAGVCQSNFAKNLDRTHRTRR
jgi:hypothetical protein